MVTRVVSLLSITFLLGLISFTGAAQERVSLETKSLPVNYEGVDPERLVIAIQKVLGNSRNARRIPKGKVLFADQTVDDILLFKPVVSAYLAGRNRAGFEYRGNVYRLITDGEFPESKLLDRCVGFGIGSGRGPDKPVVSNRGELVSAIANPVAEMWTQGSLRLKTVAGKSASDEQYLPNALTVPDIQTHYELAFPLSQPLRLVYASQYVFSLDKYEYQRITGPGFVGWLPEQGQNDIASNRNVDIVLATRLLPPYLTSKTFTHPDSKTLMHSRPACGKMYKAVRVKIHVEIVGVWQVDRATGQILKKNGVYDAAPLLPKTANKTVVPISLDGPLKILTKPDASITELAKANKAQGTVILRVVFLSNGKIGKIQVIEGLPFGLTESAIAAAQAIKFDPRVIEGVPQNVARTITYAFGID